MERIKVNVCTEEELRTVPGVGERTAAVILRRREEFGGHLSIGHLLDIPTLKNQDLHQIFDFTSAERLARLQVQSPIPFAADYFPPPITRSVPASMSPEMPLDGGLLDRQSMGSTRQYPTSQVRGDATQSRAYSVGPNARNTQAGTRGEAGRIGNVGRASGSNSHRPSYTTPWNMGGKAASSNVPKSISYDGRGSWMAFIQKFNKFADNAQWTTAQRQDNLCWCLQGRASEAFAAVTQRDPGIDYFDLLGKLDRRFGARELPETSQIEFQYAQQKSDEDTVEWADRVSHLAMRGFPELPDNFLEQQCIMRFCQGCRNKDAGQWALNMKPSSLEEAVGIVQWTTHTSRLVHGKTSEKKPAVRQTFGEEVWGEVSISKVGREESKPYTPTRKWSSPSAQVSRTQSSQVSRTQSTPKYQSQGGSAQEELQDNRLGSLENKIDRMEGHISEMRTSINRLTQVVNALSALVVKGAAETSATKSPARTPLRSDKCFRCNQSGHFQSECPLKSPKSVSFASCDPNLEGLETLAALQPNQREAGSPQ
ncbi:uncharacterized protein LOC135153918 [Lytechinus pictus]|uniref:uncharacterized protein LOC135153918 n=1 Tax=Lytechinus pictus TaxID=7653 RepID=UPI0030BA01CD